jgi:hypothetical protein
MITVVKCIMCIFLIWVSRKKVELLTFWFITC